MSEIRGYDAWKLQAPGDGPYDQPEPVEDDIEDEQYRAELADYEAHQEEQEQAHYRQLEGEEREREERYADLG